MKNFTIFTVNLLKELDMRYKNETVKTTAHPETGEFITETTSKTFTIKTTSDKFYFHFYTLLQDWIGLSNTQKNVLAVLCSKVNYNTNEISLNKYLREEICKLCNIKYQTLANTLYELKSKDIINITKGQCFINEAYFWKGDLKTREEYLKNNKFNLNIEFENEE